MQRKMKLLITSAGSLVGQNILDALEDKRNCIEIVGINSEAVNPRNFRYDRSYLVPRLEEGLPFKKAFLDILQKEDPDMILPGRDVDATFLAEARDVHPDLKRKIPLGSTHLTIMMLDKWLSYTYAAHNRLPFADSYLYSGLQDAGGLQNFLDSHPFPLLIKPRRGFGSLDVRYVLTREQIDGLLAGAENDEILFQEYLGPMRDFDEYSRQLQFGIPLFFQVPENNQFAAQTVISMDGNMADVFVSVNTMVLGRAEYSRRVDIPEVEGITREYARALTRDGWYGPLNLQYKQDRQGSWKVFEMNPRMTGTTSARYMMGYDEIGILTDFFLPELKLPNHSKDKPAGVVFKYLKDYFVSDTDANVLQTGKIWKKF